MPDEVIAAPAKPAAALARGRCFPFGTCFAVRFEDDDFQTGGFILRDASLRAAPPAITAKPLRRDEVLQTLMVRSAAKPRVSNHEARMPDNDAPQPEMT
jgi:hypothetical protein